MKIPIVWPAVILAVLIGLGVGDHLKLRRLRDRNAELAAAIATRTDASSATTSRGSRTRSEAQALAAECLSVGRRETELRKMELLEQLGSRSPAEVEKFLAEVRAFTNSGAKLPQFLNGALYELSVDHPRLVLDFLTQTPNAPTGLIGVANTVSRALSRLVAEDPSSALEWMKANPGLVTEDVQSKLVSGAAANDPRLALKLIGELGFEKPESIASRVATSAKSAGARTDMVAALREYIPTIPAEKVRKKTQRDAFENLAGGIIADGFEKGEKWINQAGLTPEELSGLAEGLTFKVKGPETGRWLEWAGAAVQVGERDSTVKQMMFKWVGDDPAGAEAWLVGAKESSLRNLAIRGYVDAIAGSEPEVAIKWAMVLPSGKSREDAFKWIHRRWPRHDPAQKAAAEAFAEKYGLK
jgi:hypothetical protein